MLDVLLRSGGLPGKKWWILVCLLLLYCGEVVGVVVGTNPSVTSSGILGVSLVGVAGLMGSGARGKNFVICACRSLSFSKSARALRTLVSHRRR
jgi:hypothetical protein